MNKSSSERRTGRLDARFHRVVGRLKEQERTLVGAWFLGVYRDAVRGEPLERFWVYELRMYVNVADARGVESVALEVGLA